VQEKIFRDGIMIRGGSSYADGLNFVEKVCVMLKRLGSISFSDFLSSGGIDIHHTDQFRLFDLCIFFCMELAKVTDTDDADLDFFHLPADPSLRTLDELEEMLNLGYLRDLILCQFLHRLLQCQAGSKNNTVSLLQSPQGLL